KDDDRNSIAVSSDLSDRKAHCNKACSHCFIGEDIAQRPSDSGGIAELIRLSADRLQVGDDSRDVACPAGMRGYQPKQRRNDLFVGNRELSVLPSAAQTTIPAQRFKALFHIQRRISNYVACTAKFGQ